MRTRFKHWFLLTFFTRRYMKRILSPQHDIVHAKDYAACPEGYTPVPGVFTRYGPSENAYIRQSQAHRFSIDYYLRAEESAMVPFAAQDDGVVKVGVARCDA